MSDEQIKKQRNLKNRKVFFKEPYFLIFESARVNRNKCKTLALSKTHPADALLSETSMNAANRRNTPVCAAAPHK